MRKLEPEKFGIIDVSEMSKDDESRIRGSIDTLRILSDALKEKAFKDYSEHEIIHRLYNDLIST